MAPLTFPKAQNKVELIGLLSDELAVLSHRHSRSQQLDAIHFVALMSSVHRQEGVRTWKTKKKKEKRKFLNFSFLPTRFSHFHSLAWACEKERLVVETVANKKRTT